MEALILALVLWVVLGLAAVVLLWVGTIGLTGLLAVRATETDNFIPPILSITVGIILTLGAFVLVAYNVIATIIAMVNYGG